MCGIFGAYAYTSEIVVEQCRRATNSLTHRGPDQWGEWHSSSVYLGHRRLSILDVSDNGRQPLTNFEESVVVTVNGEIYNYKALKSELSKYPFKGNSDSEVVLYGYCEWGIKGLLERLDGMFAFCIYDKNENSLFLARDHCGIKPLYWGVVDNSLVWGSELKALKEYSNSQLDVDYTAVYDYLTYRNIPHPKTLYKNIQKLSPARYLQVDTLANRQSVYEYWSLQSVMEAEITPGEAQEVLRFELTNSIQEQMVSDVELGIFLSGGIDSNVIASVACKTNADITSCSLGFSGHRKNELGLASQSAQYFGIKNKQKRMNDGAIRKYYELARQVYDEPFSDSSFVPTLFLCESARNDIEAKVMLSGDGGDELFGGYSWYFLPYRKKSVVKSIFGNRLAHYYGGYERSPGRKVARYIRNTYLLSGKDQLIVSRDGMTVGEKRGYRNYWEIPADYDDYWFANQYYRHDLPFRKRQQYLDFHTFLQGLILTKVDRASMYYGLEVRVPFLSKKLVEFAFSLPESVTYFEESKKPLLRGAFRNQLPRAVVSAPKTGLGAPVGEMVDKGSVSHWNELVLKDFYPELDMPG